MILVTYQHRIRLKYLALSLLLRTPANLVHVQQHIEQNGRREPGTDRLGSRYYGYMRKLHPSTLQFYGARRLNRAHCAYQKRDML
jgi:hypothetical protein